MHDDHEKPVRIVGLNIGNGCAYDEKKRRSVTSIVDNVDRLSLTSVLNTYSIDKVFDQKKKKYRARKKDKPSSGRISLSAKRRYRYFSVSLYHPESVCQ